MKKHLSFIIAAMLVLGTAINLHANNYPTPESKMIVKVEKGEAVKTMNVYLANLQKEHTYVTLQDMSGHAWFSDYIWGDYGFAKKFNLNDMPEGDYIFMVANKEGFEARMINLQGDDFSFFRDVQPPAKPGVAALVSYHYGKRGKLIAKFTREGGKALGLQLANLEGKPANVTFNTVYAGVLIKEEIYNEHGYAKWFNTEELTADYGYLRVETEKATIVQYFKVTNNEAILGKAQRMDFQVAKKDFTNL